MPRDADAVETKPLHVVSVLTTHAAGGAEFAAIDLLDALARRDVNVRLLTNRPELAVGTHVVAAPIALGPKLRRSTAATVAVQTPLTLARLLLALRRDSRDQPIDVLLLHHKKEQLLSALIPRSMVRSVVWAEWGPLPLAMRGPAARALYRLASRRATAVIAESSATERSLRAAGISARKTVVVPNVLEPQHIAFDSAARRDYRRAWGLENAFVLGCVSRLDPDKPIEVLIDAMEHLDDQVALVIAGEGQNLGALRARAAHLGQRVRFLGGVRGHVAQVLSACDVQVYAPGPSEGAARAITLGQLVGRPVVAAAPEGARGLVGPGTGIIADPANHPRAVARCVELYRSDPPRVEADGAAGRDQALQRIEDARPLETLVATLRMAAEDKRDPRRRSREALRQALPYKSWLQPPAGTPSTLTEPGDHTLRDKSIVCVGFADWDATLPTNQHHLMSRLAQTNRVLFIESLGLRRPQVAADDARRIWRRLQTGVRGLRQVGNVHVLSPLILPLHNHRLARMANRVLLRRQVGQAVAHLGFDDVILWGYVPQAEVLIADLEPSLIVYHCVDDLAAQKGIHAGSFRAAEERFLSQTDLVLASAPALAQRLRLIADRVIDAPNVADVDFFATAIDDGPIDDALALLPSPRIVFTGAIVATKLDVAWLVALAQCRPDWSFALFGPIGLGDPRTDVSRLRDVPNIHLLGPRPYYELPHVLRGADAALIPYALNALTASVFPMKVYEYLAAGLPIVSTPLPALHDVRGVSTVYSVPEAASELERLMREDTIASRRARSRLADGHSWTDRLAQIASAVEALPRR